MPSTFTQHALQSDQALQRQQQQQQQQHQQQLLLQQQHHQQTKLKYDIHSCSSHSPNYPPKNIIICKPNDQSSRWSSGVNNQLQYVMLKLDQVSIVQSITFGKYIKVHVCNLKEFKVFGGLTPNNMVELLHNGLKNDTEAETFRLKTSVNNATFPCQYIKIAPLLAWGANFNFSIWYVELKGISDKSIVEKVFWDYTNFRENEVIRLCLKHFRQRNYLDVFEVLQRKSNLQLEDPLLSELHRELVLEGNFSRSEELIQRAFESGLFEDHVLNCSYKPTWRRIYNTSSATSPCMRGGHQMCIDSETAMIYLFGGWDGEKDLADFWEFNINSQEWRCISLDTRGEKGPDPRSCHKICFDSKTKYLYTLGRYVDPDSRPNVNLDGDFWRFNTTSGVWTKLSSSTLLDGGPELIYDHQMVIDSDAGVMYVFGGLIIGPDPGNVVYSGLYSYHMDTNRWRHLRSDNALSTTTAGAQQQQPQQPPQQIGSGSGGSSVTTSTASIGPSADQAQLRSRIGHSMLLNPLTRELYIFAGQRNKDYLSDFYVYDIDTDTVHEVSRDYSKQGGPDAGFTQRATIDPALSEFYILSGLHKDRNSPHDSVKNSFWCYNLQKGKWTRVYHNGNTGQEYWSKMKDVEPCPRYAHQLVYCPVRKVQYLFGGNPGDQNNFNLRLDDFWELHLNRPRPVDVLRRALFKIRCQRFREMCLSGNPGSALSYLQTQISIVVNHSDEVESKEFRQLTQHLLFVRTPLLAGQTLSVRPGVGGMVSSDSSTPEDRQRIEAYNARTDLYDSLIEYFPLNMREPKGDLVDFIDLVPSS